MEKSTTVAFTGHRNIIANHQQLHKAIQNTVQNLYDKGYRTFLSGMAMGFDMMAAEVVLEFQASHPDVQLIAVVPFIGQENYFTTQDKARYHNILERATQKIVIADHSSRYIYLKRNDYLVDNSSFIVCYYDGGAGGTSYTVRRAQRHRSPTVNLY